MIFVISIFVVVKERVVNSKCIFMLFLLFLCHFFGVFIRAILERVCQSCNVYNVLPFCFAALNLYLSVICRPICLYEVICPCFLKAGFISPNSTIYQNRLSRNSDSNKGFIRTLLGCVDMYCHQKLLS